MTKSLDEIADRLYGLPPARFISARGDEVAAARMAGDGDIAKAVARLRRPTVGAWMVNLLALNRPGKLAELFEIGAATRAAQSGLKGDELRRLSSRRRSSVAGLVKSATELAVEAGAARSGLPVTDVETTLTAALADNDIARDVRSARLLKTVRYDGFGETPRPDLQLVAGGRSEAAPKPPIPEKDRGRPLKAAPASREERARTSAAPRVVSSAALARRRSAARRLHQAEVALTAARNAYQAAEAALRSAEQAEQLARGALEAAERGLPD